MSTQHNDGGPVERSGLSTRLVGALRRNGCATVGQALRMDPADLKATWNVGETTYNEFMRWKDSFKTPAEQVPLRDFFAAHAPRQTPEPGSGCSWVAEQRTGMEDTGWTEAEFLDDPLGFWAQVEAVRRYRFADAMLRAREAR